MRKAKKTGWIVAAVCVALVILAVCDGVLNRRSIQKAAQTAEKITSSLQSALKTGITSSSASAAQAKVNQAVSAARKAASEAVRAVAAKTTVKSSEKKDQSKVGTTGKDPVAPVVPVNKTAPAQMTGQADQVAAAMRSTVSGTYGSYFGQTAMSGVQVYEYGRSLLSQPEQEFYEQMAGAVMNLEASTQFESESYITPAECGKILNYFLNDHSEVSYFSTFGYAVRQGKGDYIYKLSFSYAGSSADIRSRYAAMQARIAQFESAARQTAGSSGSDLAMEKALHDLLIANCSYDRVAITDPDATPADSFTAYGALVRGTAVCDGYARAMKLLLSTAGIRSLYVTGYGVTEGGSGGHAWNMAYVPDSSGVYRWVYLDATWDDPVAVTNGKYTDVGVSYLYFNFTSEPSRLTQHTLGAYEDFDLSAMSTDPSQNYQTMPQAGSTGG